MAELKEVFDDIDADSELSLGINDAK